MASQPTSKDLDQDDRPDHQGQHQNSAKPAEKKAVRHPLKLPAGSVRALLALAIISVVIYQTIQAQNLPLLWSETLLIVLAHYFTSRRMIELSDTAREMLEKEGYLSREAQPLYLPKHSIRILIFGSFVGLGVYLYQNDRLFESSSLTLLGTVAAYLLGVISRSLRKALGWEDSQPMWIWQDAKALVAIVVVIGLAVAYFMGQAHIVPKSFETAVLGLVLFYFGSR